jgi:hypothetical protein
MGKRLFNFDHALDFATREVNRVGDPDKLPVPIRTVVMVHAAQGIIDNGGLHYFFESDFPGQPNYKIFVDAYRLIGADKEAQALQDAVQRFPFAEPHLHRDARDEFLYGDANTGAALAEFSDLLCGNENVWRLLAAYAERNAASFAK